jgi:hypothetical protein
MLEEIKQDREFINLTPRQINWLIAEVERAKPVLDAAVKWQLSDVKDPQLTDDVYGLVS